MDARYAEHYTALYQQHWWWRARERLIVREVAGLLGGGRPARMLDVGCGAGLLADAIGAYGAVEGVERDEAAASRGTQRGARIWIGDFDESYRPDHQFDLVIMADVLEHLPDPGAALRKAASLLSEGGHVLITVPALRTLWTSHDVMNQHYTRYTAAELLALADASGLMVRRMRYFFGWLVLPKLLVRVLEGWRATHDGEAPIPRIPAPWVNRALTTFSVLEDRWLGAHLPFGSSLLAVCARQPRRES